LLRESFGSARCEPASLVFRHSGDQRLGHCNAGLYCGAANGRDAKLTRARAHGRD
jgi:hypothetical protein